MQMILAVAAGGALGAVARYGVYVAAGRLIGHGFPWATLIVNIAGSFLLAAFIEVMALRLNVGAELRAFLAVGVMGAFTTFSTFSLDVATLVQRDAWLPAAIYVGASVIGSIGAFFLGLAAARAVLAG